MSAAEEMRVRIAAAETLGPVHAEVNALSGTAAQLFSREHAGELAAELKAQNVRAVAASIFGQTNANAIHASGTAEQKAEQAAEKRGAADALAKLAALGPAHAGLAAAQRMGSVAESIYLQANGGRMKLERDAAKAAAEAAAAAPPPALHVVAAPTASAHDPLTAAGKLGVRHYEIALLEKYGHAELAKDCRRIHAAALQAELDASSGGAPSPAPPPEAA